MSKKTILICDDHAASRRRWQGQLNAIAQVKAAFDVQMLEEDELKQTIKMLEERRRRAREDTDVESEAGRIDTADVLIIDYDLRDAFLGLTGERVSYLARCYSACGVIIALNQYEPHPVFDLTLRGHPESFADLNLHASLLDSPGLWAGPGFTGFRPWSWPLIPRFAEDFERRVADAAAHGGDGILETLCLKRDRAPLLARDVESFLGGEKRAETVTFEEFVQRSGHGLQGNDKAGPTARSRIAAARVTKWLERLVLPGQDVLADAPHLASRYPSLLRTRATAADWTKTAQIPLPGKVVRLNMHEKTIAEHEYPLSHWVSRPVWYWAGVSTSEAVAEVVDPWSVEEPPHGFAEDTSAFHPLDQLRPFQPAGPTTFIKRFVLKKRPDGAPRTLRYLPLDHFADLD